MEKICQEELRRALQTATDRLVETGDARFDLACEIALRAGEQLVARARRESAWTSLDLYDQVRLIEAVAPFDFAAATRMFSRVGPQLPLSLHARLAASLFLARPGRCVDSGSMPFLVGQTIPIVQAEINECYVGAFLVDTGAPHSALSRAWCERVGLSVALSHPHQVNDGSGNTIDAFALRLNTLVVGGRAHDIPAIMFQFPSAFEVAGILSPLDVFGETEVAFDFVHKRLHVGEGGLDAPTNAAPLYWRDRVPCVLANVGAAQGILMADTGAGGDVLCSKFAKRLNISAVEWAETQSAAALVPIRIGSKVSISVAGHERTVPIALKPCLDDDPAAAHLELDGLLGMGWMTGRQIIFDADRRHLRMVGFNEGFANDLRSVDVQGSPFA